MELISAKEAMSILSWDRTPSQFYAHVSQGKIPMAHQSTHSLVIGQNPPVYEVVRILEPSP